MAGTTSKLDKFLKKRIDGNRTINDVWDVYEALIGRGSDLSDREIENIALKYVNVLDTVHMQGYHEGYDKGYDDGYGLKEN